MASTLAKRLRRDHYLYLMLIPFLLWYVIFIFKPMYGLQIAFRDFSPFKGITGSPWVGLENFRSFYESPYFFRNLVNTVMISLYSLLLAFPVPIVLALLFNEVKNTVFRKTAQTFTYLPHFISVVIVAGIVTNLLAPNTGIINLLIEKFGGDKVYFLTQPQYFRTIFIATFDIWKEAGFNSIVYLAAIAGINPQLYEAAVVDGASKWKQIRHVTLPGILPTVMILLIMKIGNMMDVSYEAIILMYQPSTYETADVISSYVYRAGLQEGRYDLAATVGLFNAAIACMLVFGANKLSKKSTDTGIW
ncbi:MAG: sugar transporter permease [Paenibacillaceae bacterium]|nr:sugar transporter permease [Paenibacillaceae bacterium]